MHACCRQQNRIAKCQPAAALIFRLLTLLIIVAAAGEKAIKAICWCLFSLLSKNVSADSSGAAAIVDAATDDDDDAAARRRCSRRCHIAGRSCSASRIGSAIGCRAKVVVAMRRARRKLARRRKSRHHSAARLFVVDRKCSQAH